MPISFDTWLASQTPDLLAESMGLPPLARVGKAVLQTGLSIGADAASSGLDVDDARAMMALTISQYLDALGDDSIEELSRSVNIGRGVWVSGAERVEDRDQRRLLAQFLRRLAGNVYGTFLALRPAPYARAVGLLSGDFVGMVVANMQPIPRVNIQIDDIIIRPHGASLVEGSFRVNGETVGWRYITPTVALQVPPAVIAGAVAVEDDVDTAVVVAWLTEQAERLALAARAELTTPAAALT